MKKLIFAISAALPLIALANTNTVSRAEFDALKNEVETLRSVASKLRIFTREKSISYEEFVELQEDLRSALNRMEFTAHKNKLAEIRKKRDANATTNAVANLRKIFGKQLIPRPR